MQDWLSEAELGETFDNYDADHSGDISFDEFEKMVRMHSGLFTTMCTACQRCCFHHAVHHVVHAQSTAAANCQVLHVLELFVHAFFAYNCLCLQYNDGSMLAVTLAKYKLMFDEVDTSGNGTLGATEIQHFFQK